MKNRETYKGFHVVPVISTDDEMGCRAMARVSNPGFMDGVPAGLEPVRMIADRTDWSAILEYEDERLGSAAEASSSNLKSLVRDALTLLTFGARARSIHTVNWCRRALTVVGPTLRHVEDHAA